METKIKELTKELMNWAKNCVIKAILLPFISVVGILILAMRVLLATAFTLANDKEEADKIIEDIVQ